MQGRVVHLGDHVRARGQREYAPPRQGHAALVREWTVSATVMLRTDAPDRPHVACALMTVDIDAVRRAYEVSITREGWRHSTIFQSTPAPNESREQTLRREGVLIFLNELLAASYGVPA